MNGHSANSPIAIRPCSWKLSGLLDQPVADEALEMEPDRVDVETHRRGEVGDGDRAGVGAYGVEDASAAGPLRRRYVLCHPRPFHGPSSW